MSCRVTFGFSLFEGLAALLACSRSRTPVSSWPGKQLPGGPKDLASWDHVSMRHDRGESEACIRDCKLHTLRILKAGVVWYRR